MAVYVEIQTDPFAANLSEEKNQKRSTDRGARRPYRGIEIKEDTYAVMKVIRSDGSEIPLTDSGGKWKAQSGGSNQAGTKTTGKASSSRRAATYNYSNFIIQGVTEAREEKAQIMETFGDAYVFFFGEKPRFLQVQGLLMNTLDFNWRTEFWYNYENTLRGTKLVEQNARLYLYWDDLVVEGYMMNAQAQDNADMPYHIPFTFSLFVTNHTYLSQVGVDDYPIRSAVLIQPLQSKDVENTVKTLKKGETEVDKYTSTVDRVRRANINAVKRDKLGQWLNDPKAALTETIQRGIADAGLGFINNVINFFYGRNMVWPKGLAGSESYVGPAQYANKAYPFQFRPERILPLRSKIRDNVDEYTGGVATGIAYDLDYLYKVQQAAQNRNCYDMELKCVKTLATMGLNVVQKPFGLAGPFSCEITNAIDALTEEASDLIPDFFRTFDSGTGTPPV